MIRWRTPSEFEHEWDERVAAAERAAARRADCGGYVAELARRLATLEDPGESTSVSGARRRPVRDEHRTTAP